MKKTLLILSLVAVFMTTGCVATRAVKEIQQHKDPSGNLIKTVEVERAEQVGTMLPFQFEFFKRRKTDENHQRYFINNICSIRFMMMSDDVSNQDICDELNRVLPGYLRKLADNLESGELKTYSKRSGLVR